MDTLVYDFAIVGAGAAGIHLMTVMLEDSWFTDKKILILDKDRKNENDKTWCFWEKENGKWDSIIAHSWESGKFLTKKHDIDLKLAPYRYKMLPSQNFYGHAKSMAADADNVNWLTEEVTQIENKELIEITTSENMYKARQVFDSRIDPAFNVNSDNYIRLLQHFKGWFIETKDEIFDPSTFVMMDFRIKHKDSTSFMYVLPTSPNKALLEFTFFSPALVEDQVYDYHLKKYIKEVLKTDLYSINEIEKGIIPMSNFPFHQFSQDGILKIGTAGSWVKPSSGYSFKNGEKLAGKIIDNLKNGKRLDKYLFQKKYNFYDTLFLDVLHQHNEVGEELFTSMYSKNSIQDVFRFLDEQTNLIQDISIINTFNRKPFLRAINNQFF
jgi:lycopene beta-cyclase